MTDRHTVNTITSNALDALYEQLEAAQETESQRQLATAREALASATTRAARAEAALARVRHLHRPVGVVAAAEAGIEPDCATCGLNRWPCPTFTALDQPTPGPAANQATDDGCPVKHCDPDHCGVHANSCTWRTTKEI